MHVPRVYPDTSVIGGCFDPEFEAWSNALMEDYQAGRFVPVLSELLEVELEEAPIPVMRNLRGTQDLGSTTSFDYCRGA